MAEADVPEVDALVEAYSRGAGELITYLRKHETAEYLIGLIATETGVRRIYVRAIYNVFVGLVVSRGEAGARKLAGRLAEGSARLLGRLPFYGKIAQSLLRLEERLRRETVLKTRLAALVSGDLAARDFGATEGLSREAQLGLHTLREQEELWGELDRSFDDVLGRLNPRPPLTTRALGAEVAAQSGSRLLFNARRVPFVGRAEELRELDLFLEVERRFCWWLVIGPGGLGKSRLALELCLRNGVDWRAGFLRREASYDGWDIWQPEGRTLIVLDYVSGQADRARRIVTALRDRQHDLDAPVRLLLLERQATGQEWWRRLVSADATGAEIRESCYRPDATPLRLGPLSDDDLWATVRFVLAEAGRPLPDRQVTIRQLRRIDPEPRPLFATLAADALATGRDLRGWDRARLLEDVLQRERGQMWPPDVTPAEINLLALATMCGRLSVAEAEALSRLPDLPRNFLPDFDPDADRDSAFQAGRYAHLAGRPLDDDPERGRLLPPLKPDMLGEFFVLRHMVGEDGRVLQRRAERLRDAAWTTPKATAFAFAEFLHRCADDFLEEPALEILAQPPADPAAIEARRQWTRSGFGLVAALGRSGQVDRARSICERVLGFAATRPDDIKLQRMAALAASELIDGLVFAGRVEEAHGLHERLTGLAAADPADVELRSIMTHGRLGYLSGLIGAGQLDTAVGRYHELVTIANEHPDEGDLRLKLVAAATGLRGALTAAGKLDDAQVVYGGMAALVTAHPEETAGMDLRISVALEACELLAALLVAGRIEEARAAYASLRELATRWPVAAVVGQLASGAAQFTLNSIGEGQLDEASEAQAWLSALAVAHPDAGGDIRLAASAAGTTLMVAVARAGRPEQARALWHRLVESALAHPEELIPRVSLLQRASELVHALAHAGAGQTQDVDGDVVALSAEPPTIAELRRSTGARYFDQMMQLVTKDATTLLRELGAERATYAPVLMFQSDDRQRFTTARGILDFLIDLAGFGALAPQAEAWRIRGTSAQEAEIRILTARGAAALIAALLERGQTDDARAAARRAGAFIRSAEYEAHVRAAAGGGAYSELLKFLDAIEPEPGQQDGNDRSA